MNYRMISYIIGCIWLFEAAFLLVPMITALAFGESAVLSFLWTAVISSVLYTYFRRAVTIMGTAESSPSKRASKRL